MEKHLYKKTKPYNTFHLQVSDEHFLYIKQYGNKNGIPIIFLHGGPGGFTVEGCSRFFNLKYYNVVVFDQRGCGKSLPRDCLIDNKTSFLIDDIEKIRCALNFDKIILFGGSWGASLAILYCFKYPQNVKHYIIRGFTLLQDDIYPESFKLMYPKHWEKIEQLAKTKNIDKILKTFFPKIKNNNKTFIEGWCQAETAALTVDPKNNSAFNDSLANKKTIALFETYYFMNKCFLPKNYFLNNAKKIKHIPGHIIHGRVDTICSYEDSYNLHQKLPKSKLILVENAAHSYMDPPLAKAMVECTKECVKLYG